MSNKREIISPRWAGFRSLWIFVAIVLFILLLILWFLGYGPKLPLLGYGPNGNKCAVPETIVEKRINVETLVTAPDTIAPRLSIKGSSAMQLFVGENFTDEGYSALDNIDSKVDVKVTGKVDTNTPGEYVLTYTATDAAGNTSTETRTVIVKR